MRVLIFTSSGGTAHDAAAYAIEAWLKRWDPDGEVLVEHVLENASIFTRAGVALYNWIQRHGPWMHQIYWRVVEFKDVTKPVTLLAGRFYVIKLLRRLQPDLLISTHPHINRGHFDLARRVCPEMRCIICCAMSTWLLCQTQREPRGCGVFGSAGRAHSPSGELQQMQTAG